MLNDYISVSTKEKYTWREKITKSFQELHYIDEVYCYFRLSKFTWEVQIIGENFLVSN